MGGLGSPCGACKFLRRKCIEGCVFAPYFCYEEGSSNFAAIHKVFGASNFSKLISHLPDQDRCDAVVSLQAQVVLLREEASRKFPQGDCSEQGEFLAQDTPQDLHSWFHQVVSDSNLNQMSDVASTSIDHDESLCRDNKVVMKKQVVFGVILLALFLIFINAKQVEATRLLGTTVDSEIRSVFQSLQKGTVPESGRNRCTHIPKGSGKCHG
ncbi:hypothetical protein YC2023_046907 [Brassica napus]